MGINWQMIFNFILFAMIVVAFTFAIWSYIKTNAIKNSNSPSIDSSVNSNNTYVNNIASAPNSVRANIAVSGTKYELKPTDNGTTILLSADEENYDLVLDCANVKNIKGFYINVKNYDSIPKNIVVRITDNSNSLALIQIQIDGDVIIGFNITDIISKSDIDLEIYGNYIYL